MHLQAGQRLQLVERVDVERVAGRDDEGAVLARQRHQVAAVNQFDGDGPQRLGVHVDGVEVEVVEAELLGESRQDVVLAGVPLLDEQFVEGLAGDGGVCLANGLHVGRLEDAVQNETL
jgi:hypothetical protein